MQEMHAKATMCLVPLLYPATRTIIAHGPLVNIARRMDQQHKKHFAGLLSRSGADRSLQRAFAHTNVDSKSFSVSVSSTDSSDDEKGPLGLTTVYEPEPPTSPVADIVFIHGLGGGSRKTWSYSPEPRHYWPQAWLPADNDFQDVRIHTFGYKADWGERRQSILNIHSFGESLLGALRNHPGVRRTGTRIVLVGHSMGGCVAKKAYILARQDPTAADLARRMHSIFFLATPHRGSDMASTLQSILAVSFNKKPYVADLTPNSASLTAINDVFRHFAPDLRLWSFYETLPTFNRIVVERHSATLGYHNEEITPLDTNHRQICKFDTPADPNYKILRNALLTAVDLIRAAGKLEVTPSKPSMPSSEANSLLRSFLGVRESVESDLTTLQVLKQPGSCEWFTNRTCFAEWKKGTAPEILWLMGKPGAGKSVLSSHVIEQLNPPHAYCSYFICKHGNTTLGDCFRSLAFQMAMQDHSVKEALLQLALDGLTMDNADETSVWRRLFTGCIFKLPGIGQHFWVVDGVDECANFHALFTKRLLVGLPEGLRLFATSRNLEEIERGLASLGPNRAIVQVLSDEDAAEDMRHYVTTGLMELGRPETAEDRERMCEKILQKASGSFLWARLVLQRFEHAWTEEAMDAVLGEIHNDLFELYSRMVQSIEKDRRKLMLAKSIFPWVVLACRPLTIEELRCAIKLDTNQTLQNAAKAIPALCGQLTFIDQHGKVQMIHETAREFLVAEGLGLEVCIDKEQGHTRLGSLLLKYLSSPILKPSPAMAQQNSGRIRGFARTTSTSPPLDTSLLDYACAFFSEHLYRAAPADSQLMDNLCNFLGAENVLFWMEHIARRGNLAPLPRTAMNMREYLGRRMKYVPQSDESVKLVDGWVTDLIRVPAKFRDQLLACPSSIHSLIPPLCPSESVISRTFVVKGLPPGPWDDCLIRMDFEEGQTTAVSHGDRLFAIGLSTGQISLYDTERVRILEFSSEDLFLASCGRKNLTLWNPKSGTVVHSFPLQSPALGIAFLGQKELLGAFQSCELTKWNLVTAEAESISWRGVGRSNRIVPPYPPSCVTLLSTPDEVFLAMGYRSDSIFVLEVLDLQLLGTCEPDIPNNGIRAMVFSPNPELPVLMVSFQDGSLCVFDYLTMEMQVRLRHVYADSLAFSSDGRNVISGSNQGAMEVFEVEQAHNGATITLNAIYRSKHQVDKSIRGVAFSADGLRFVDVRARQGRVWAPAALVRKRTSEGGSWIRTSEGENALLVAPKRSGSVIDIPGEPEEITSPLNLSADGKVVLAGKNNGDVVLFSTTDARQIGILYQHGRGARIVSLALAESRNRVISADNTSRVLVAELQVPLSEVTATSELKRASLVLDRRFWGVVACVLTNAAGDRVLVSGRYGNQLWEVLWEIPSGRAFLAGEGDDTASGASPSNGDWKRAPSPRSVFQHPGNPEWFVVVTEDTVRVYSWENFAEVTSPEGIQLVRELSPVQSSTSWETATASYHVGPGFVVELFRPSSSSSPRLYLWPAAELDPSLASGVGRPAIEPNLDAVSPAVFAVLGIAVPSTLLLLDIKFWICSVELQSLNPAPPTKVPTPRGFSKRSTATPTSSLASSSQSSIQSSSPAAVGPTAHARRHFFALGEWRTRTSDLQCAVAVSRATPGRGGSGSREVVAFAAGPRVVVVQGGLEFSELVAAPGAPGGNGDLSNVADFGGGGFAAQNPWRVVSGSMHRRSSNW
ncbi:hypothetical protein C8A03DRAFT_46637 [Achaetomium macrosporum]|uniref:GPI inositol-deacylase n=1 Tax=Achaetomium macrosporum TaxID=79813 RepID=A0AAN7C583_9PEZI|nr:hypothetical protein C8A03DRAFT_46637 [Achaetomium macrosporum]